MRLSTTILPTLIVSAALIFGVHANSFFDCTLHQYIECDVVANCTTYSNGTWECVCPEGMQGDGLIDGTGCGRPSCQFSSDCHPLANCTSFQVCQCAEGFTGDGGLTDDGCMDIDECSGVVPRCSEHANCTNTQGSFTCTCMGNYIGDGFTCQYFCNTDLDCKDNKHCVAAECVCRPGYELNLVTGNCDDINECDSAPCHVKANCINNDGSFRCKCKAGYFGTGFDCAKSPRTCDEIYQSNPRAPSQLYTIDPDGTESLPPIKVFCDMRNGFGITILKSKVNEVRFKNNQQTKTYVYEQSINHIKSVIQQSTYCYQDMSATCRYGARLLDGNDYWIDGNNNRQYTWGGSTISGYCACGVLGYCSNPSEVCNCEGVREKRIDNGREMNKDLLPIREVKIRPGSGNVLVEIGDVKCAPNSFDLPLDCHEARFRYNIRDSGPQVLDFDGPGGISPILAHCDMTSYDHVGITVIPHRNRTTIPPIGPDIPNILDYVVNVEAIKSLIDRSYFCKQFARYTCKNSRLLNTGDIRGFFSDIDGNNKTYWPGGMGEDYQCGCGLTGTCEMDGVGCNCDIEDDVERTDFGFHLVDGNELPIGSMTFSDVGPNRTGSFFVGPLMCSQIEFGIPATCDSWLEEGFTESYTYFIDPDGPSRKYAVNNGMFPAYCEMHQNPDYAVTVINPVLNGAPELITYADTWWYQYRYVSVEQLIMLTERAVYCTQAVTYSCTMAPLHAGSNPLVRWMTRDNRTVAYFAGTGRDPVCQCGLDNQCASNLTCNCDVNDPVERQDDWSLTNKDDLPLSGIEYINIDGQATVSVGPMKCYDLFPNCYDKKQFNKKNLLDGEKKMNDGVYAIDPDGPGGVPPFTGHCIGFNTRIYIHPDPLDTTDADPSTPKTNCYTISYQVNGEVLTPEQVQALVDNSNYCYQELSMKCVNAPITNRVYYSTCDGVTQTGWAGSLGQDMCDCGVTGTCDGGPDVKCNCDNVDGQLRSDGNEIYERNRLPVCGICVTLDPAEEVMTDPKTRTATTYVSDLVCDQGRLGGSSSCQDKRNEGMTESTTVMLDPDKRGWRKSFPVYCGIKAFPPIGYSEVRPKLPEIEVPETGIDIIIEYYAYDIALIQVLVRKSRYCQQELTLICHNSSLNLNYTNGEGWYDSNGFVQTYWAGNSIGYVGCTGGSCKCNQGGLQTDGGIITHAHSAPVLRIKLPPAEGYRRLTIGPLRCYDLFATCHEIKKGREMRNPLGNDIYAIDPDQEGPIDHFPVKCDFNTDKSMGITVIETDTTYKWSVEQTAPGGIPQPILYYRSVTYEQIHALTTIETYCYQGIKFYCFKSPLITNNDPANGYYTTYGGGMSTSFGVAGHSNIVGCPCVQTNTCPNGYSCHCDPPGAITHEYAHETDRDKLPITHMNIGGQTATGSRATYQVSDLKCGPKPFDLPRHCDEALNQGFKTGEVLIQPHSGVNPFLVYCDMGKYVPTRGVTIIKTTIEYGVNVTWDDDLWLTYYDASHNQVRKLVEASKFCYMPFKYTCRNTKFLVDDGYFYWVGGDTSQRQQYTGAGNSGNHECNCGAHFPSLCGGKENRTHLTALGRRCNCDAADDELRADAGVFRDTNLLPIKMFRFDHPGLGNAYGHVKVGPIYCSQVPFDIDECKTGFHDCHPKAKCINTWGSYECRCKPGWRGRGRPDRWANGRECYDDDECTLNYCPPSAVCTNFEGGASCTCKPGYEQTGPRKCRDINECVEATDSPPCHTNATCINLQGRYVCRCNRGFKGDGFTCEAVGECVCFGDPHCVSYDDKILHFQGTCQYVMSTDCCMNNPEAPSYEVLTVFSTMNRQIPAGMRASWVKEVLVNVFNYSVFLGQHYEVQVNGYRRNLPYRATNITVQKKGRYVILSTPSEFGLEVRWNGQEIVQVFLPGQWKERVCGLCGNYNDNSTDDWTTGPICPNRTMSVAQDQDEFGNSWAVPEYAAVHPGDCEINCTEGPRDIEDPCRGLNKSLAKQLCDKVFDLTGAFKPCFDEIRNMGEDYAIEFYYNSCVYDVCRVSGDKSAVVCAAADALLDECRNTYQVDIQTFRADNFCDVNCEENTVYYFCGPTVQLTCYDILTNNTPTATEGCMEGCFCPPDLVTDVNSCVNEADCGCLYDGNYYSVGETVTLNSCQTKGVCMANHTFNFTNIVCHENATCSLLNGVYGCHCFDGFFGNGVDSCQPDPCEPSPCNPEETCHHAFETERGYICICALGYTGECNECEEIDECLTGTHECPAHSHCINTPGSYECVCKDGYLYFGGECEDINECDLEEEEPYCGNNSKCTNKIGSYECPCCQGYEKAENDTCVPSESTPEPDQPYCCTCTTPICDRPGQVCGEDAVTYNSIKDMIISNCEKGLHIRKWADVDYYSSCKGSCSDIQCPLYQTCVEHPDTGEPPSCECTPCTEIEIISTEPVCTTTYIVYPNICEFKQLQCMFDDEVELFPTFTPCEGKGGSSPVGPWSNPGPCSVSCGIGTQTRTRQAKRNLTEEEQAKFPLETSTECYRDPCPDGPCFDFLCPSVAHVCEAYNETAAECRCPKVDPLDNEKVCGYLTWSRNGSTPETWKNAGQLKNYACKHGAVDFTVMNVGECGEKPLDCTRILHYDYYTHTFPSGSNCTTTEKLNWYTCDGGCGDIREDCCHTDPDTLYPQILLMDCDGIPTNKTVEMIDTCKCQDIEIVHGTG